MKLYYSPGACSLADHLALNEAGANFDIERVDLKAKTTETGADFTKVNAKGYVPAVVLDSGEAITENIAILDYVAANHPELAGAAGALGRTRMLEMLAFISTEMHKQFKPFWYGEPEDIRAKASKKISQRFQFAADNMQGDYLFGANVSVADCYLFVMLLWAERFSLEVPQKLQSWRERMNARPAVQKTLKAEGLAS